MGCVSRDGPAWGRFPGMGPAWGAFPGMGPACRPVKVPLSAKMLLWQSITNDKAKIVILAGASCRIPKLLS